MNYEFFGHLTEFGEKELRAKFPLSGKDVCLVFLARDSSDAEKFYRDYVKRRFGLIIRGAHFTVGQARELIHGEIHSL